MAAMTLAWLWPSKARLPGPFRDGPRAKRKNVRAGIGLFALHLLGRHVLQRAEDHALGGDGAFGGGRCGERTGGRGVLL